MNRTDRLLAILLEFQSRRELRAEDLAHRFEVSVRTVYRDVQALSEGGVPIAAQPGKGYRLLDGFFLPPLALTADEAAALALGGAFVRDRVDPALRRAADDALRKLRGVLPPDRLAAVERRQLELRFPRLHPPPNERLLATLRAAIEGRRVVHLRYQALNQAEPTERAVEPVSLAFIGDGWYLAAYCRLRRGARVFRLDRIDACDPLAERFGSGERHRIDLGPDHLADPDLPDVRVRFDAGVLRRVRERQPFTFRREETDADGPVFVYALRDEPSLVGWLLSWGAAVHVLSPDHLKDELAAAAAAIVRHHAPETRTDVPTS